MHNLYIRNPNIIILQILAGVCPRGKGYLHTADGTNENLFLSIHFFLGLLNIFLVVRINYKPYQKVS
jgi:hypothetical protein